jgi:DNA-directed RNA polymerase II subunit RPB7
MIPPYIKFDSKASPPQWTDTAEQIIEKGTHVRVKIKGTRNEMGQLFAIATINEASPLNQDTPLSQD